MAKKRRVIRTVDTGGDDGFESQLWSIYVAIVVLGGFSIGMVLAFTRFDDPRWYANAWTWLIVVPVIIGGVMVALPYIENRYIKRATQFSLIVGLIFLSVAVMYMKQKEVFGKYWTITEKPKDLVPPKKRPRIAKRTSRKEFEKPVERKTPDIDQDLTPQKDEQPKPDPPQPQPQPEPDPEPIVKPNEIKKTEFAQELPRFSEQQSLRSSKRTQSAPQSATDNRADQIATPTNNSKTTVDARTKTVKKRQTASKVPNRNRVEQPTTPTNLSEVKLAKKQADQTPDTASSAAPVLPRKIAKPTIAPKTDVQSPSPPAVAQQTQANQPKPNNTTTRKQNTTSPTTDRTAVQPTPDTPANLTAKAQRQQQPSPEQPTLAQTRNSISNRRPRLTRRPNADTSANVNTPTKAPTDSPQPPTRTFAKASPVKRTSTERTAEPRTLPTPTPTNTPSPSNTANVARRQLDNTPQTTTSPTTPTTPRRNASTSSVKTDSVVKAVSPTNNQTQQANAIAPRTTDATKQSPANRQVSKSSNEPTAAAPSNISARVTAPTPRRQPQAAKAPSVAQSSQTVSRRREQPKALPNVATTASSPQNNQSPTRSNEASFRPSLAKVAKQPTVNNLATQSRPALNVQSASNTTQTASPSTQRATPTARPSIAPSDSPSRLPTRSTKLATNATSPTNVESPTLAVATGGSAKSTAQPAKLALSKAVNGKAGSGQSSVNLDRAAAADNSPALTASGAARRPRTMQNTSTGPALSPSEVAQVRRSRTSAPTPSASRTASSVDSTIAAGDSKPTEFNASSSAALANKSANADSGPVSATKGNIEFDLGSTRVVAENQAGRASGGGQPELNFETQAKQHARSSSGAAPQMSLAANTVADTVAAPSDNGGGRPPTPAPSVDATAAVRNDVGGDKPVTGGPSLAAAQGPATELSSSPQVADAAASRTEAAEAAPGSPTAGGGQPDLDDEEEKARQLARSALRGAPALSLDGPSVPSTAAPAASPGGSQTASNQSQPTKLSTTRNDGGGTPASAPMAESLPGPSANTGGGQQVAALQFSRTEAVEAALNNIAIGGGTASPLRNSAGPSFSASTQADTVSLAGAPSSSGAPQGAPLKAQGLTPAKLASGAAGDTSNEPSGAKKGDTPLDAPAGNEIGAALAQKQSSPNTADGPLAAADQSGGTPLKRATITALPSGNTTAMTIELPQVGPISPTGDTVVSAITGGDDVGPMSRQSTGGLKVKLAANEGPGGIGDRYSEAVGLNNRRARRESMQVRFVADTRFQRQNTGGRPDLNTSVVIPSKAFDGRTGRKKGKDPGGKPGKPSPQTEKAIEDGLVFLARHQSPDGSWSLNNFGIGRPGYENERAALRSDSAATGLALLAFQGAGYNHREHKYQRNLLRGVEWLVKHQKEDGDLYTSEDENSNRSVWLYSHSIAALALCEAYGMTQDPALREPAQKALDFIVKSQNKDRGGWRYSPGNSSDTSVTGWMMMALKSGELSNLDVPTDVFKNIQNWLDKAQVSRTERHLYRYNPWAPNTETQRHGRMASKTMTSVGLLMRLYSGWRRDNKNMVKGAEYLEQHLPAIGTPRNPQRDTYYWYYATQVMFHMGGEHWKKWNEHLHPLLADSQVQQGPMAGSWNPRGPVPDKWAPHAGRIYVTAMNLLSLEVYYRILPLYDDTAK